MPSSSQQKQAFYWEIHLKIKWQEILLLLWSRAFPAKWPAWDSNYELWARLKTNKQQKPFWALWTLHKTVGFLGELKLKGSSQLQMRSPPFQLFPNCWTSHKGCTMGEILLEILSHFLLKELAKVPGAANCKKGESHKAEVQVMCINSAFVSSWTMNSCAKCRQKQATQGLKSYLPHM